MGLGHEYLARINEALAEFEEAVCNREKFKPMQSKAMRQHEVVQARQKVIDVIVDIVTKERMQRQ